MTLSDVFLYLAAGALGLGAAMVAFPILAFALLGDEMSERVENWAAALWTLGPWLLMAAVVNGVLCLVTSVAERLAA